MVTYLEVAYDLVEADPSTAFDQNQVENKLGMDEDVKRHTLRDLENRGLVTHEGGTQYRLTLPAIHSVEEHRLAEGRDAEVDPLREERGDYVRTVFDLAEGDPTASVPTNSVLTEMELTPTVERRTRAYLVEAGLLEEAGEGEVRLSEAGAEWAMSA